MRDFCSRAGSLLFAAACVAGLFVFGQPGEAGAGVSSSACGLYEENGTTAITVTSAGTYYAWASSKAGVAQGDCTLSTVTDSITLNRAGVWFLTAGVSFSGTANSTQEYAIHQDATIIPNCSFNRKLSAGGDVGRGAVNCLYSATAGDVLDLRVTSSGNGDTSTPARTQFSAILLN